LEHIPVSGSHVPTSWHWSCAVQTTGALVQLLLEQVSVVHVLPSLQLASTKQHPTVGAYALPQVPAEHVSVVHAFPSLQCKVSVQLQLPPT